MNTKIYRCKVNPIEKKFKVLTGVLAISTIILFIVTLSVKTNVHYERLIGTLLATITMYGSFCCFGVYRGYENHRALNALALINNDKLIRVYFTKEDVSAGKSIPYGTIGKLVSIERDYRTVQNIHSKDEFLDSENLALYVEGVITGAVPYEGNVRIEILENTKIVKKKKWGIIVNYTSGKDMVVDEVSIIDTHEGYEEICNYLNTHPTKINYEKVKKGDCIAEGI